MPAVTADTMTLPRLSVDPASTLRTVPGAEAVKPCSPSP